MRVFAPAKVNLGLRVLGVRADGFHALDSVVVPLGFGDDVELEQAGETSLEAIDAGVGLGALPADIERNLAVRAARLLEREAGRPLPTRIRIVKRIPLGGGLGGGSTDAAAVLRGMNDLWGLGLPRERLCALGAELGSDVPLFLLDGTVRMRGRGELVERLDMAGAEPLWLVLANDGTHCPTPQVYRAWDEQENGKQERGGGCGAPPHAPAGGSSPCTRGTPAACQSAQPAPQATPSDLTRGGELWDTVRFFLRMGRPADVAEAVGNDLSAPCLGLFPGVARTAEALRAAGCMGVTLCGSGATVFGLVGSRAEGERALAHPALAGCWRACTQTLPDGVMAAHGPLTPIVMVRIHVGQPCSV